MLRVVTDDTNNFTANILPMEVDFIQQMPKVELHLHIEGTMEPEMLIMLARRNNVLDRMKYKTAQSLADAYTFTDLQSFLDLYYQGCNVLLTQRDFYDLTMAYLTRANKENIRHVEIFFDPQAHTSRGVPFDTVVNGISSALADSQDAYGISCMLIMCILRDRPEQEGMETLEQALRHRDKIAGIGLDSAELGNPPSKFEGLFARARAEGFFAVAHAGEEGPPAYIWEALDKLHVNRIDHGVRCIEDAALVSRLAEERIPLTICPSSNIKLKVFNEIADHNLKLLLDKGLCVTINSDDPAYFGAYLSKNYLETSKCLGMKRTDIVKLARNAIEATSLSTKDKNVLLLELDTFVASFDGCLPLIDIVE